MKSWISGETPGIAHLSVACIPKPDLKDGYMRVRVTHGALNFSDLLMIAEQYQVRPPRPFTPGQELVGFVDEAPAGSGFQVGDRIASKVLWGAFAEYALVRTDMAMRVPEHYRLAQAAALPVSYTTALVALDYCGMVKPSNTVLIHAAAGGVGLASVEIAAARGSTVIAAAGSDDRLSIARDHGAKHIVNYRNEYWVDQVKALTAGKGVNLILDPVGGEIGEKSLRCISMDGKLLIVGFASGKMPKLAAHLLLLKRASAVGVYWNHDTDPELLAITKRELEALIIGGHINPRVDDRDGFDDLPSALDKLENRRVSGKMVLRIGTEEKVDG